MMNWLLSLIPADYSWGVAVKKISYTAGKVAIAFLVASKAGPYIQSHTTPDQLTTVQDSIGVATGAVLTAIHDWLHMKFPDAKWL